MICFFITVLLLFVRPEYRLVALFAFTYNFSFTVFICYFAKSTFDETHETKLKIACLRGSKESVKRKSASKVVAF